MDFEVIEIVDDNNPYPAFLGLDWATDMNGFVNLKKWKMIFEKNSLHVVVPLDLAEEACYTELLRDDGSNDEMDCIYKIIAWDHDGVNLTADGRISWVCVGSFTSNSNEEDERWHNRLNEVTTLNYNMMTRSLCCVTTQAQDLPTYDGLIAVDEFLSKFKSEVPK